MEERENVRLAAADLQELERAIMASYLGRIKIGHFLGKNIYKLFINVD